MWNVVYRSSGSGAAQVAELSAAWTVLQRPKAKGHSLLLFSGALAGTVTKIASISFPSAGRVGHRYMCALACVRLSCIL